MTEFQRTWYNFNVFYVLISPLVLGALVGIFVELRRIRKRMK